MTEEMKKMIMSRIQEEETDIDTYMRMSEEAMEHGMDHCAGVLCDIKHDEMSHVKHLKELMEE